MDKKFVPYDFRNQDFSVDHRLHPTPNAKKEAGCAVTDDWEIIIPSTYSRLVKYYSGDFFLFSGMRLEFVCAFVLWKTISVN